MTRRLIGGCCLVGVSIALFGASASMGANGTVEAPSTVRVGRSVPITVHPHPSSPSELITVIASDSLKKCPNALRSVQHQWQVPIRGDALHPQHGRVRAGRASPDSTIRVCAYQGHPRVGPLRLIGMAHIRVTRRPRRVVFQPCRGRAITRPAEITPCGINPPFAKKLTNWRNWGRRVASSSGALYYNTCRPACAVGYRRTRGVTTLSRIRKCGRQLHYTRIHFAYPRRPRFDVTILINCLGRPKRVSPFG